jgi:glycosyltransferase involved in cell wall biosynthesis
MHKGKIRILFILENFRCGGGQRTTVNLLRHLDGNRFEPILFLLEREGVYSSEIPEEVKVIFAHKSFKYNKYLIPYYLAKIVIEAHHCDVIIGALELRPTYLAYLAGALTNKPAIGWVHVPLDEGLQWATKLHFIKLKLLYPRLTRIVCVSKTVKQSLLKMASVKPERIKVIYCPQDLSSIIKNCTESIPGWAVDIFQKPTLVAVGRLSWEKGFDLLISAHAKVLKSGIGHNLIIIGDGPHRVKLQELVHQLKVTDSVFLPGYVKNPYPLMKKAIAFVLSSRFEGLLSRL